MAKIGLKYVVAAALDTSNETTPTYTGGRVLGKAISADISINYTDDALYADDAVAERVKEFKNGTFNIGLDDLALADQAWILGHSTDAVSGGEPSEVTSKSADAAPYVGIGIYATRIKNNARTYRAIWFTKVMFAEPQETMNTKGENTTFGTPTLPGTIDQLPDGTWKIESEHATEAEAIAWLNEKANIAAA